MGRVVYKELSAGVVCVVLVRDSCVGGGRGLSVRRGVVGLLEKRRGPPPPRRGCMRRSFFNVHEKYIAVLAALGLGW